MKTSFKGMEHRSEGPLPTPAEIYGYLDRYVIGQRQAKRTVAIAAYNHLKRVSRKSPRQSDPARRPPGILKKSNILLIGPTGCGKTHIARNLAECLKVPFAIVDATEYTEAGYYGKDVEVMVAELLYKANHAIEETQRGIIFVDEVDKIARRSQGGRTGAGSRDIGGEGVQQSLLKLLEGRELFVPLNVTQHWNKHDFVQVDTADILFICAGTFSDIHTYGEGQAASGIGFGSSERPRDRRRVTHKDLLDYGLLAEFLGRLPVVVELDELGEEELLQVLTVPPDSVLREYQELLLLDDLKVNFSEEALREIVHCALRRQVGARGLRSIFEEVCHDLMFEAPDRQGEQLNVGSEYVRERLGRLSAFSAR